MLTPQLISYIDKLSKEELANQLFIDSTTRVLNRNAYNLAKAKKYVSIIDLDSLKYINDSISHRKGDILLLKLATLLSKNFSDVYRISGDEFVVLSDCNINPQLKALQHQFKIFSFGTSTTLDKADLKLQADKQQRESSGLRAQRGEQPPWYQTHIS